MVDSQSVMRGIFALIPTAAAYTAVSSFPSAGKAAERSALDPLEEHVRFYEAEHVLEPVHL
jgi:hypothetical protein